MLIHENVDAMEEKLQMRTLSADMADEHDVDDTDDRDWTEPFDELPDDAIDDDDVDELLNDVITECSSTFISSNSEMRSSCDNDWMRTFLVRLALFAGCHSSEMLMLGNKENVSDAINWRVINVVVVGIKNTYISFGLQRMSTSTLPVAVTRFATVVPLKLIDPFGPLIIVPVCTKRCCRPSIMPPSKKSNIRAASENHVEQSIDSFDGFKQ